MVLTTTTNLLTRNLIIIKTKSSIFCWQIWINCIVCCVESILAIKDHTKLKWKVGAKNCIFFHSTFFCIRILYLPYYSLGICVSSDTGESSSTISSITIDKQFSGFLYSIPPIYIWCGTSSDSTGSIFKTIVTSKGYSDIVWLTSLITCVTVEVSIRSTKKDVGMKYK